MVKVDIRSEETKEKIRQANLGLEHPEWRNKIKSEAQGGDNHWTQKKEFSDNSKSKMSETHKMLYENGYVSPVSKSIIQYSLDMVFIKTWKSAVEIKNTLGFSPSAISQCLTGKIKTSNKYIWKYE